MAGATIGAADEFWRLRITRVDTTDEIDFEWHDDILYRQPQTTRTEEFERWIVEAVDIADFDTTVALATFDERDEATRYLDRARDDLAEMTKTQFEEAYLPIDDVADDAEKR